MSAGSAPEKNMHLCFRDLSASGHVHISLDEVEETYTR